MKKNAIFLASLLYVLMGAFYLFINGLDAFRLLDEMLLVAVFCVGPMLLFRNVRFEFNRQSEVSFLIFVVVILSPVILLLIDRVISGFTLDINPVLMRDQMLARHREGVGGTIFSVGGNLLTIPAYMLILDYFLFSNKDRVRGLLSVFFLVFMVWVAGSRAFILVVLGMAWMLSGFPKPRLKHYAFIGAIFIALSGVFILRAIRSEIPMEWYVVNVLDHLQVSYDFSLVWSLGDLLGVFVISFAYVFHSLETVAKTIELYETPGISIGPISHMLGKLTGYYNGHFEFPGLFMTEFGNVLYDFGWSGVVFLFGLKVFAIHWLSRCGLVIGVLVAYFLLLNGVFGVLSPLYNLLFFYPVIFSCFMVFIWRSKWIKLRYL